jgi:hypothetical protein
MIIQLQRQFIAKLADNTNLFPKNIVRADLKLTLPNLKTNEGGNLQLFECEAPDESFKLGGSSSGFSAPPEQFLNTMRITIMYLIHRFT